jgi:hypothetical protein
MAEAKGKKDSSVSKPKARAKAPSKTAKTSDEVRLNAPEQSDDILFSNPSDNSPAKVSKEDPPVQTVEASDDDLVFTPKKKTPVKVKSVEKVDDKTPAKDSYTSKVDAVAPDENAAVEAPKVKDVPKYTASPEDMAEKVKPESNVKSSSDSFSAESEEAKSKGYDDEVNSRYEEIKRGSNHLTDLQQKSLPELVAIAKEVGITEVEGLAKQNLVFLIIKERVKEHLKSCPMVLAFFVVLITIIFPALTIFIFPHRRFEGLAFAPVRLYPGKLGLPKKTKSISPF